MSSSLSICIIDAFTEKPFSGNQAAVCFIGNEFPSDSVLQTVAAEMNLAETAFVVSKFKTNSLFPVQKYPIG